MDTTSSGWLLLSASSRPELVLNILLTVCEIFLLSTGKLQSWPYRENKERKQQLACLSEARIPFTYYPWMQQPLYCSQENVGLR